MVMTKLDNSSMLANAHALICMYRACILTVSQTCMQLFFGVLTGPHAYYRLPSPALRKVSAPSVWRSCSQTQAASLLYQLVSYSSCTHSSNPAHCQARKQCTGSHALVTDNQHPSQPHTIPSVILFGVGLLLVVFEGCYDRRKA